MKVAIYKKQTVAVSPHVKRRSKSVASSLKKRDTVQVNLTKVPQLVYDANRVNAYKPLVP